MGIMKLAGENLNKLRVAGYIIAMKKDGPISIAAEPPAQPHNILPHHDCFCMGALHDVIEVQPSKLFISKR